MLENVIKKTLSKCSEKQVPQEVKFHKPATFVTRTKVNQSERMYSMLKKYRKKRKRVANSNDLTCV